MFPQTAIIIPFYRFLIVVSFGFWAAGVSAQILPDATLPNNSTVNLEGEIQRITGGTEAGANLFHSFEQFNLGTGETADFNNALTIENIITRVTGGQVSNIDGLIQANGTVNLFLLNPNGIVFGENARLDIGGSFFGSTAESLVFEDGSFYSATEANAPPLLTLNVPIGLQLGANPGAIQVEGTGHRLMLQVPTFSPLVREDSDSGLQVSPGRTLALVGGDVTLSGGTLTAPGGRIELGSARAAIVGLKPLSSSQGTGSWSLDYTGVSNFQDIQLRSRSLADASGDGGGSIQLRGRTLQMQDGSVLWIQNRGAQASGSIHVNAAESVEIEGTTPDGIISALRTDTVAEGRGGDIAVSTRQLSLTGGAQVLTQTFSAGTGGNVTVEATEFGQFIGFSPVTDIGSGFGTTTVSSGRAGNLTVSTKRLTILEGALTLSITFATGNGGDVRVNVSESIELIGANPNNFQSSTLSVGTFNAGNAGSLSVNTSRLVVRDGGAFVASTLATGDAGSITVNASESVEVSGTIPGSFTPSLIDSAAIIREEALREQFRLPDVPSGNSGDVTVNTPVLRVTDDGQVSVRNDGSGNSGTLAVNADSIVLDNRGGITATSISGEGGNITLHLQDDLILRNHSQISARAGTDESRGGNGGNITIDTNTLTALERSNINANALMGNGGNIEISTTGLFLSPDSKITASSQFGVDGIVEINTPDLDSTVGLVEFPQDQIDLDGLITQHPCRYSRENSFTLTGRSGLPEDPRQFLQGQVLWEDWSLPLSSSSEEGNRETREDLRDSSSPLVEAQGWVRHPDGTIELVASTRQTAPQHFGHNSGTCQDL